MTIFGCKYDTFLFNVIKMIGMQNDQKNQIIFYLFETQGLAQFCTGYNTKIVTGNVKFLQLYFGIIQEQRLEIR